MIRFRFGSKKKNWLGPDLVEAIGADKKDTGKNTLHAQVTLPCAIQQKVLLPQTSVISANILVIMSSTKPLTPIVLESRMTFASWGTGSLFGLHEYLAILMRSTREESYQEKTHTLANEKWVHINP